MNRQISAIIYMAFVGGIFAMAVGNGCLGPGLSRPLAGIEIGRSSARVAVVYHPYGPSLERATATPRPNYQSWPDERIERDFRRLTSLGVNVVMLAIDPADFGDTYRIQRYRRLIELTLTHPEWPRLMLLAIYHKTGPVPHEMQQKMVSWAAGVTTTATDAAWEKLDGRALLVIGPGCADWSVYHPALCFRFTAPARQQWCWPEDSHEESDVVDGTLPASRAPEQYLINVASRIPKKSRGRALAEAWAKAVAMNPQYIVVNSWNNYHDGSFIEPNSLDDDQLTTLLAQCIAAMRQPESPEQ